MPIVLPAPVTPRAYSGLMLYLAARSTVVYWPGVPPIAPATLAPTSPASAPVRGIVVERLLNTERVLMPLTDFTTDASAAGIAGAATGAWKRLPSKE